MNWAGVTGVTDGGVGGASRSTTRSLAAFKFTFFVATVTNSVISSHAVGSVNVWSKVSYIYLKKFGCIYVCMCLCPFLRHKAGQFFTYEMLLMIMKLCFKCKIYGLLNQEKFKINVTTKNTNNFKLFFYSWVLIWVIMYYISPGCGLLRCFLRRLGSRRNSNHNIVSGDIGTVPGLNKSTSIVTQWLLFQLIYDFGT